MGAPTQPPSEVQRRLMVFSQAFTDLVSEVQRMSGEISDLREQLAKERIETKVVMKKAP